MFEGLTIWILMKRLRLFYKTLKTEDLPVSEAAAHALIDLGSARSVKPLIKAMLVDCCPLAGDALRSLCDNSLPVVKKGLRRAGSKTFRLLMEESATKANGSHADQTLRLAITLLGLLGDPRAFDVLAKALNDARTRYETATALGNLGDPRATDILAPLLADKDEDMRIFAALALAKLGDLRAVALLSMASKDAKDARVRDAATDALRAMAAKALIGLGCTHEGVRGLTREATK